MRSRAGPIGVTRIAAHGPPIQRKATLSSPGDPLEREADAVAEKVIWMPEPGLIGSTPAAIQRKCAECDDEEKNTIQTKPTGSAHTGAALDADVAVRAAVRGGTPLPAEVRSYFEPRFGHDFRAVRVHADRGASNAARAARARAYTVGRDIVFGSGEYAPATAEGKQLLAHELVHVLQQAPHSTQGTPRSAARGIERRRPGNSVRPHFFAGRRRAGRVCVHQGHSGLHGA